MFSDDKGNKYNVKGLTSVHVGRQKRGNQIVLAFDDEVSAKHCLLEFLGSNQIVVSDLNSSNGTTVNQEIPITAGVPMTFLLELGFMVSCGQTVLTFEAFHSDTFESPGERPFTRARRKAVTTIARNTRQDDRASPDEHLFLVKDAVLNAVKTTVKFQTLKKNKNKNKHRSLSPVRLNMEDEVFLNLHEDPHEQEQQDDVSVNTPQPKNPTTYTSIAIMAQVFTILLIIYPFFSSSHGSVLALINEPFKEDGKVNYLQQQGHARIVGLELWPNSSLVSRHAFSLWEKSSRFLIKPALQSNDCFWTPPGFNSNVIIQFSTCVPIEELVLPVGPEELLPNEVSLVSKEGHVLGSLHPRAGQLRTQLIRPVSCLDQITIIVTAPFSGSCLFGIKIC